jgi:hypothetical protein
MSRRKPPGPTAAAVLLAHTIQHLLCVIRESLNRQNGKPLWRSVSALQLADTVRVALRDFMGITKPEPSKNLRSVCRTSAPRLHLKIALWGVKEALAKQPRKTGAVLYAELVFEKLLDCQMYKIKPDTDTLLHAVYLRHVDDTLIGYLEDAAKMLLRTEDSAGEESEQKPNEQVSIEGRAIALIYDHHKATGKLLSWPALKVLLGPSSVSVSTLKRRKSIQGSRTAVRELIEAQRARIPKGYKSADGTLDAYEEEE